MIAFMAIFDVFAETNSIVYLADQLRFLQQMYNTVSIPSKDIKTFVSGIELNIINKDFLTLRSSGLITAAVFSPETLVTFNKTYPQKAQELLVLFRDNFKTGNIAQIIPTDILLAENIQFIIFIDSSYKRIEEVQGAYEAIIGLANDNRMTNLIMQPLHIQLNPFSDSINSQSNPLALNQKLMTEEAFKAVSNFAYANIQHFTTHITVMVGDQKLFEVFKKKALSMPIITARLTQDSTPESLQPILPPPTKPATQQPNNNVLPLFSSFTLEGITAPPKDLNEFSHSGASVLPYIEITSQNGQNKGYVLLGREAEGRFKGTYNDFGGKTNPNETSLVNAAREFNEESIRLVNNNSAIQQHLQDNTPYVLVYQPYRFVIYITRFKESDLENLTKNFYTARDAAKKWDNKEKDMLAWVAWEDLVQAIKSAKRGRNFKISTPVTVQASVVSRSGVNATISNISATTETITLANPLVNALEKFVKLEKPYQSGFPANALFY